MPGHVSPTVGGDESVADLADDHLPAPVRRLHPAARRTSGRERHDEKITVYVSSDELFAIEHARLALRADHGIAIDRGRLIREAVAEMLHDLEANGDGSDLVRRLRPA